MKAVVLCAGEGTRLRPLTFSCPKHFIPVANRPVISRILDDIKEAGIKEVGIVVSPHVEDEFKRRLGDGSEWNIDINYILQPEPRGLAHAVQCVQDFVQKDPFLVYLGDNLLEEGIKRFIREYEKKESNALISLYEVENPHAFGVADLEGDKVVGLVEKPEHPPSNLAVIGTYVFDGHIFDAIQEIEPSSRGELEITDAIQKLIDRNLTVSQFQVKGWWKDVGKPEDMLEANRLLLEGEREETQIKGEIDKSSNVQGKVIIGKGAKVEKSKLRGPCIIGGDTKIKNSSLGPYCSIGKKVNIYNSEIEFSIVMRESNLEGARRISHSLIGQKVKIRQGESSNCNRFIIGDNSRIILGYNLEAN